MQNKIIDPSEDLLIIILFGCHLKWIGYLTRRIT